MSRKISEQTFLFQVSQEKRHFQSAFYVNLSAMTLIFTQLCSPSAHSAVQKVEEY
jgi:hypothetical protein